MSGNLSGELKAEPNLTPLLDVVFQLITFFMLLINFSQDNYDQRVRLPVAGSARPVDQVDPNEMRLVLNIDRDGKLLFNREALDTETAIKEIERLARIEKLSAEVAGIKIKPEDGLPTVVVIRADKATPFSQFFRLVTACQANGFRKFALKAMGAEG